MPFDSNKRLNVLIPKGRFFRAILKYLLKDTSFSKKMYINPFRRNGCMSTPFRRDDA
jgi:hypothetical protein